MNLMTFADYSDQHRACGQRCRGILKDGHFLAIEIKSPTGRVSRHQQHFIDEIAARGGVAFVARSLEEVEAALSKKSS
jgi:hypothetical protein